MPEHIMNHSVMVAKIARLLTRSLESGGYVLSVERATAGALLHDIGKISALKAGGDHCELGRMICLEEHCDEIAEIVSRHVRFAATAIPETISEEEIVYYSDKRVKHDQVGGICVAPFFARLGGRPGRQSNAGASPYGTTWRQNMSLRTELPQTVNNCA